MNENINSTDTITSIIDSSAKERGEILPSNTYRVPTNFFLNLISLIDSAGFISDTNRIKKILYYAGIVKTSPVFLAQQFPFYRMDTASNPVFKYVKQGLWTNIHHDPNSNGIVNTEMFPEFPRAFYAVKNITGFYFRDKNKSDPWTDGFIEEWKFNNTRDAENAENAFNQWYTLIYFNSFAHIFRIEEHLYVIYSRSNLDAQRLENLYKKIRELTPPSRLFLEMTNYLDIIGYSFDTLQKNCFRHHNKCFRKIILPNHEIFRTLKQGYDGVDTNTIKKELFIKAKSIYSYFYKIKKRSEYNPDGAIEEWQFENESDAENAGLELNRIRNVVFFYTVSFVARTKNRLYVFHNRASFSDIHRKTIKRFSGHFDVQYPRTIPNSDKIAK